MNGKGIERRKAMLESRKRPIHHEDQTLKIGDLKVGRFYVINYGWVFEILHVGQRWFKVINHYDVEENSTMRKDEYSLADTGIVPYESSGYWNPTNWNPTNWVRPLTLKDLKNKPKGKNKTYILERMKEMNEQSMLRKIEKLERTIKTATAEVEEIKKRMEPKYCCNRMKVEIIRGQAALSADSTVMHNVYNDSRSFQYCGFCGQNIESFYGD